MQISIQMYSVRDALATDFQGTMQRLVDLGFSYAEPFNLLQFSGDLGEASSRLPIAFPSAHQSFLGDGDFQEVLEAARAVGVQYLIDPYWEREDWTDAGKVRALAARLNDRAAAAAAYGIRVGYHNHHFEIASRLEGLSLIHI